MESETHRGVPAGIIVFLGYAFLLLAGIGISMRWVVDQAIDQPVSPIGIVWMCLLAYTIFTITLVLQRKQAAWGFSLGLASLTVPLVPLLGLAAGIPGAVFALALALLLFRGLLRPSARAWFQEP